MMEDIKTEEINYFNNYDINNYSFNNGNNISNDSFSGQPPSAPEFQPAQSTIREQLNGDNQNPQIRQISSTGQIAGAPSAAEGGSQNPSSQAQANSNSVLSRFHWTSFTPYLYTALLLYLSCLSGYFSLSGACFFLLYIMHSYAYYGFRGANDPVDVLTNMRHLNKSTFWRVVFKWCFVTVSLSYLVVLTMGRLFLEYNEVRTLIQDEERESVRREEIALERSFSKIIPNYFSYWTLAQAIIATAAAFLLIKIQIEEEEEASLVDQANHNTYADIHYSRCYPQQHQQTGNTQAQQQQSQSPNRGQLSVANGAQQDNSQFDENQIQSSLNKPNQALNFKPTQVQKCVLIFKDYKFKVEIFVCVQIFFLVIISNAQYCVYGLPYLALTLAQLLNFALSHGRSDQNIRVLSSVMTVFLVVYLPLDLLVHYVVHYIQESQRIDDEYDARFYGRPSHYQLEGYQGVMATTPSYVTFALKLFFFVVECLKYKYSYDMAPVYDKLKHTYLSADSSDLPQSFKSGGQNKNLLKLGISSQPKEDVVLSSLHLENQLLLEAINESEKLKEDFEEAKIGENLQTRINQQNSKDFARKQRYNKLLKLQYIKIFRKSFSFVHKILQPISLFMICVIQLIFVLCHPSVLFIVLLGMILSGFFVDLKDYQTQTSFTLKAKIVLCIECLYVFAQYLLNIFKFDSIQEIQRKEELTILLGIGTQQQLGYYEDEVNIFDSLFPFNYAIVFLFWISIFTRYMGKPKIQIKSSLRRTQRNEDEVEKTYDEQGRPIMSYQKSQLHRISSGASAYSNQRRQQIRLLSENSSERRYANNMNGAGGADDDMLTVLNDDNMSISGYSDLRSQRSRRSNGFGGVGGYRNFNDNRSQIDLYQNIIEEEDENDLDEEDEENDLNYIGIQNQSERKSLRSASENNTISAANKTQRRLENQELASLIQTKSLRMLQQHQSAFDFKNRLRASRVKQLNRTRADPVRDSTLRGKIRQWFHKTYISMVDFIDRVIDISIVHINKVVLLTLFLVSVYRPTLINVILFIMFLVLSMVSHQNEYKYLRLTLLINSFAICIIYTFDVFIQRDFSTIRTWVLHIIGVQYRRENVKHHLIKLKYLPYIILQIILVLSDYVFQSDKYKYFKSQYMDIEGQRQEMIVRQMTKRYLGSQNLSEKPLSKHSRSLYNSAIKSNRPKSIIGGGSDADGIKLQKDESNTSFQKEGGADEHSQIIEQEADATNFQGQSLIPPTENQHYEESKVEKDSGPNQISFSVMDNINHLAEDQQDKMTLPDEAKTNLMKQHDMIVMFDPASKFIIRNAAYFLIFFLFVEIVLLPLSIMNIILIVLMTIIVIKMLFCETRLQTYRSLANVLQVLNIFAIIYIFTKYMFLWTQYTQNIQLKNSIENGYHQQGVNDDGTIKHSDRSQEQQKTEDARNQLHHSHDHDDENQGRSFSNKILQKMFGFQKSEDQKNEGGTLLSFKLLILAIVLSLTNLQLNILRHRNLAFLLGEKDRVLKLQLKRDQQQADQNTSSSGSSREEDMDPEERRNKIAGQKLLMNKQIAKWKDTWRWWHYTKIYFGFLLWFILPVSIIISTFCFYPLNAVSVPSVIMVIILLILLAVHASPDCWRTIYKSIGTLVQLMICTCYILYFALLDQMSSYDLNDPRQRQQYQNIKVLWGLYQSGQIIHSQSTGQADDVASILTAIIPLFIILCVCFLQKEIDKWYEKYFNVTVHVNSDIRREILRFELKEAREVKNLKKELDQQLKAEAEEDEQSDQATEKLAAGPSQNLKTLEAEALKLKRLDEHPEVKDDISYGTLGAGIDNHADPDKKSEDSKTDAKSTVIDEEGKEIHLDQEGDLPGRTLHSLLSTEPEVYAQSRGDNRLEKGVTNQFLIEMIQQIMREEPIIAEETEKEGSVFGRSVKGSSLSISGKNKNLQKALKEGQSAHDENFLQHSEMQTLENKVKSSFAHQINKQDQLGQQKAQQEDEKEQIQTQMQHEAQIFNDSKRFLEEYIVNIIEYETPYRHCYFFKNEIWTRYMAIGNSMNLLIYFGLYAILNKMNLLSLIYWICLYRIIRKNFKPNIFKSDGAGDDQGSAAKYNEKARYGGLKNQQILSLAKIQLVVVSFLIIVQLSFSIYTNIQFAQQEDLQKSISNTFCPNPTHVQGQEEEDQYDEEGNIYQTAQPTNPNNQLNKECAQDWSYYLLSMSSSSQSDEESQKNLQENQEFTNVSVTIDLLFLLLTYLLFFVASGQIRLTNAQKYDHPVINDKNDFVSSNENSSSQQKIKFQTWKLVQTCFFIYLPYFIIVYLMYVSSSFNGRAMSDLLSSIYLWFALKFIIDIKKLFAKNTKILRPLRTYNRIVLLLILIYQMPLFLCPSSVDINGYTDPDYIDTEDCALIMHHQISAPTKKQYEAKQPMQLYIILSQSMGLLKQNSINMTFLLLFFLTEAQHQIFQHPHFKEYVVKHMILEKESDGKVRAFMYCERFHLTRLWAYRAIKEEIKILHKILLRLNDQISKSDFHKNLAGFVEYHQKPISSTKNQLSQQEKDEETKALLLDADQAENEQNEERKSFNEIGKSNGREDSKNNGADQVDYFIELNSHIIDSIALANLRADKPVVPLKIIQRELRISLSREISKGELNLLDMEEEALTKHVNDLIEQLEEYICTKNRIDLYNKEGLGLALALNQNELDDEKHSSLYEDSFKADSISRSSKTKSAEQYLKGSSKNTINRQPLYAKLYKSYNDAILSQRRREDAKQPDQQSETSSKPTSKPESKSLAPIEERKSGQGEILALAGHDNPEHRSSSSQSVHSKKDEAGQDPERSDATLSQDFNPSPASYEIDAQEEEETVRNMTWAQKINYQFRLYLWMNYIDHILFVHLEKCKENYYSLKKPLLQDYGILRLIEASILSHSHQIVIIAIVFNFIMNANLIALFIVFTVLFYSILENPLPSSKFWKFLMSYVLLIISLKFLYQLQIFCGTPVYTFYSDKCNNEDLIPQVLASRIDYIIGIHKFSGPASYPRNQGIFLGILADILLLMTLLLHKQYLSKIGAWNYVQNKDNIYKNPSFSIDGKNLTNDFPDPGNQNAGNDLLEQQEEQPAFVYEQASWYEKVWYKIKKFFYSISNFYGKVLPQYMDRKQKNLDVKKRQQKPFITHKFGKVKPGRDFFTNIFFTLLLIIIYTLIYWKNISGEDKAQSFGAATVSLDRFSTIQVITLFLILILLLFERMLYRARYVDDRDNLGKFQTQTNIQHPGNNAAANKQRHRKTAGTRHTLTMKLLVYYSLIILIHIYLGFAIPLHQLAPMSANPWLVIYYLFWCCYFYYSALQIKHGYPMAPYKQAFSNDTGTFTYTAWRTYKAIPFVWEMKVIIDWTVTSTCLDLFQWFKLDDAYNTLYYNQVQSDNRKSRPEFQQRSTWEKILQGFCFALGLIFVILAPILLFSGINPIMVKNPVNSGTLTIDIELIATGNSYRIFETQASRIQPLTKSDDVSWRLYFEPQSNLIDYQDMQKLQFNTYSESQWTISPPSLKRFINDFKTVSKDQSKESNIVNFKAQWIFIRNNPSGKEKTLGAKVIALTKKDFLPVIEMLERDNSVHLPGLGTAVQQPTQMKLSQTSDPQDYDESYVQLEDDIDVKNTEDNQLLEISQAETKQQEGEALQSKYMQFLPQTSLQIEGLQPSNGLSQFVTFGGYQPLQYESNKQYQSTGQIGPIKSVYPLPEQVQHDFSPQYQVVKSPSSLVIHDPGFQKPQRVEQDSKQSYGVWKHPSLENQPQQQSTLSMPKQTQVKLDADALKRSFKSGARDWTGTEGQKSISGTVSNQQERRKDYAESFAAQPSNAGEKSGPAPQESMTASQPVKEATRAEDHGVALIVPQYQQGMPHATDKAQSQPWKAELLSAFPLVPKAVILEKASSEQFLPAINPSADTTRQTSMVGNPERSAPAQLRAQTENSQKFKGTSSVQSNLQNERGSSLKQGAALRQEKQPTQQTPFVNKQEIAKVDPIKADASTRKALMINDQAAPLKPEAKVDPSTDLDGDLESEGKSRWIDEDIDDQDSRRDDLDTIRDDKGAVKPENSTSQGKTFSPSSTGAPDPNGSDSYVTGNSAASPFEGQNNATYYYPNGTMIKQVVRGDEYEYKEVEDGAKGTTGAYSVKHYRAGKAQIAVKDAFPKIIHLNAKTENLPLAVTELQTNTSKYTSMELQLNRQGNQIYYWTFSLGSSDGRGGKNRTAYQRDTPGVFNSRNSQDELEVENKAEKRKQSTSKIDKKLREKDKAEMQKKKVQEEQNLVILLYNEEVIGSFFGSALQLSVVGLYATIVIAIGRFIRIIFDRISQRVMYEELPRTKQLFEICEGIFIAQQEGDLVREKQLYDLLILMYRSPEALIKITGTRLQHQESPNQEDSTQGSEQDAQTLTSQSNKDPPQRINANRAQRE